MNLTDRPANDGPKTSVFNRQRKFAVDMTGLKAFLRRLALRLKVPGDFSVMLVSDRRIQSYNARFAGKNRPTDVLSFPTDESHREQEAYWGDIVISVETADRQRGGSLLRELQILSLHGVLHLLGYDHERDGGRMVRMERKLRREMNLE